jgi:hypothetical protein
VVLRVPSEFLPIPLGLFILLMTWRPQIKTRLWFPGEFLSLGFVQAFLTLFVGATGPLNLPFLIRAGLTRDQLVVTVAGSYADTKLRPRTPEKLFLLGFKLLISLLAIRMTLYPLLIL